MEGRTWASCACLYTRGLHSTILGCDVAWSDKDTFLRTYEDLLEKVENTEDVVEEVMAEVERRKQWSRTVQANSREISGRYSPQYREFFEHQDGLNIVRKKPVRIEDDIFTLPLLSPETCDRILQELHRLLVLSTLITFKLRLNYLN